MINKNDMCLSTYYEAWHACMSIFAIACQELFDPELNHICTREYREKCLEVCKGDASPSYVKVFYDPHGHDHYMVNVPEKIVKDLMERAIYEDGMLKIGDIRRPLR
ncbi:MAG: hypothetical protein VZR53_00720 [Prevotella sp.]|nr:hypothetical protein [Prevotella sp.]